MATHFSANQYESAFAANHLQNYQIPDSFKEHPAARGGTTKIVANDCGHLLPGIPRSKESPWGTFKGTWDMDCRKTKHCQNLIKTKSETASALKSFNSVRTVDVGATENIKSEPAATSEAQ